jgi:hypothetical protein
LLALVWPVSGLVKGSEYLKRLMGGNEVFGHGVSGRENSFGILPGDG